MDLSAIGSVEVSIICAGRQVAQNWGTVNDCPAYYVPRERKLWLLGFQSVIEAREQQIIEQAA